MDIVKKKWKKNMVLKLWKNCCKTRSSMSSNCDDHRVVEQGCFSVYVGPQRQRFVIKTEFANHPLFQMLLEDAELEYGFTNEGPLLLPCDVDLFNRVLAEIINGDNDQEVTSVCSFAAYSPLILCSPSRRSSINKGYGGGSYEQLLTPS